MSSKIILKKKKIPVQHHGKNTAPEHLSSIKVVLILSVLYWRLQCSPAKKKLKEHLQSDCCEGDRVGVKFISHMIDRRHGHRFRFHCSERVT